MSLGRAPKTCKRILWTGGGPHHHVEHRTLMRGEGGTWNWQAKCVNVLKNNTDKKGLTAPRVNWRENSTFELIIILHGILAQGV